MWFAVSKIVEEAPEFSYKETLKHMYEDKQSLLGDDAAILRDGIHGASTEYEELFLWDHTQVRFYAPIPGEDTYSNIHHASAQDVEPPCGNPLTQVVVQSCHALELLLEASIAGFIILFM